MTPDSTDIQADLPHVGDRDEVGWLFAFANLLLSHRRAMLVGMAGGLLFAVINAAIKPAAFVSTVSFMPQGSQDVQRTGLAALAGQFGVGLGGSSGAQSPKFYTNLFLSYDFLAPIARESLTVAEQRNARKSLAELYDIKEQSPAVREEAVVAALTGLISSLVDDKTGTVTFSVTTKWPSVSRTIADRVVARVNDYNLHVRQSQAAAERRFTSERLAIAKDSLTAAENRLKSFLESNRNWTGSPDLTFTHGRLSRATAAAEQLTFSLNQSNEEARIREVRDTPVITVIEPARLPFLPQRRRLISRGILGLMSGGLIVAISVLIIEFFRRRRRQADPDLEEFVSLLRLGGTRGSLR